ncbi:peptidase inhibitor family I36 protein [Umezawaea beigongshangensis]|uniref:peptidase inhibitor family I36 protein n=1 Tax=Umezawaea beigongshangensis TaxID=2780383 RepID=UPI0018F12F99|nr:peptidase inhibitor family I36 protein [Umezawaea beigongshangensis]
MTTRTVLTAVTIVLGSLTTSGTALAAEPTCDRGEFCAWEGTSYTGAARRLDLESANPGECIPLPENLVARSFANRLQRTVSVYQGQTCSTEADFTTYPGGGTYVPEAPFVVRAVQVWES